MEIHLISEKKVSVVNSLAFGILSDLTKIFITIDRIRSFLTYLERLQS